MAEVQPVPGMHDALVRDVDAALCRITPDPTAGDLADFLAYGPKVFEELSATDEQLTALSGLARQLMDAAADRLGLALVPKEQARG